MNSKIFRRQIAGLLLIVTLVNLAFPPLNVYAAKEKSKQKTAKELEKSLEQQYGIEINLASSLLKNDEKAYIYLADLREALYSMPEAFVLAIVKHFKSKGKATTISFSNNLSYMNNGCNGVYNNKSNTITLMNPTPSVILHEFGHMVQEALNHKYGYSKLKSEFTAFNKKIPYGKWKDDYFLTFASEYANTSFEEDFAEVFAYSIALSHNIREVYDKKKDASLIKKSAYIKEMIESRFKVKIPQDMWRIYPQTPSKKYASGIEEEYGYTGFKKSMMYFLNPIQAK